MVLGSVALISPYGLVTRTALLGTGAFIDSGSVTAVDVTAIVVLSLVLSVLTVAVTTAVVNRRDTRT